MSDQTVSVPLYRLRVMPPQGAPVVRNGRVGILCGASLNPQWVRVAYIGGPVIDADPIAALALDLTAPTTSRIDGATVAATMLAEAAGVDAENGVSWDVDHYDGVCAVVLYVCGIDMWSHALDVDLEGREALAAVLVAVLGVDRE